MITQVNQYKFNDIFESNRIDFKSFDSNIKTQRKMVYTFDTRLKQSIINEFKQWLQNMRVNKHTKGNTLYSLCVILINPYSKFILEYHPEIKSTTEIPIEQLYGEFIEYLEKNNYGVNNKITTVKNINANMQIVEYTSHNLNDRLRIFKKFYNYLDEYYNPINENEYNKDIWNVQRMGIKYNFNPSHERKIVNFNQIKQDWLKNIAKEYSYMRLKNRNIITIQSDIRSINYFSKYVEWTNKKIKNEKDITRDIIEEFIEYLKKLNLSSIYFNKILNTIKTFIDISNICEIGNFTKKPIILDRDYMKLPKKIPTIFSDNEIKQLNKNIDKLKNPFKTIFFLIERHGLRLSDICPATIYVDGKKCIEKINSDTYIFRYFQTKTKKLNSISIDYITKQLLEENIENSIKKFGKNTKYIFATGLNRPVSEQRFVEAINKYSLENKILGDNGKLLRVNCHTFRRTFASDYANMGIDLDLIRSLLGQTNINTLKHYIKIHGKEMKQYLKPIIERNNQLIASIGTSVNEIELNDNPENYIPLSCGYCSKDIKTGICEHANACYDCPMFKPTQSKMYIYKKQLQDTKMNILICEANGYEKQLAINKKLKENLENIINDLQKETKNEDRQNSTNIN